MLHSRLFRGLVLAAGFTALLPTSGRADFITDYQVKLAAGQIADAAALAQTRLDAAPDDAQARFALGTAQFLAAIEGLGHDLYLHGLESTLQGPRDFPGVTDLPFLRLPVSGNPKPQPMSAQALREMLVRFAAALETAEQTLASVPPGPVLLPLDVNRIAFDFNGDGQVQNPENLQIVIYAISGQFSENSLATINFDEGDVPWLRGYTQLLSGITDMVLAHDFSSVVDQTFQDAFPASSFPSSPLHNLLAARIKQLAELQDSGACQSEEYYYDYFDSENTLTPEQQAKAKRFFDCQEARDSLTYGGVGDLVAFIHLIRWPVVEPARLTSARQHLLNMITLSRESWAIIDQETDNDHEWVPNPRQTGPFANLRVTTETVAGWKMFLDQAEGVLNGTLLIPHWRFEHGMGLNVRRMFESPQPFDPVLLITGQAAVPYIETGTLAEGSTMETAFGLLGGGMLSYFFWFN